MPEKFIKKSFTTIHKELNEQLADQKQGFAVSIAVGEGLFPGSLPPRLEIVLLDPGEMTVAFRKVSNARGVIHKKGEWNMGPASSAAEKIIAWIDQMMSVKSGEHAYVVEEI